MTDNETRINDLTRVLEDILDCFIDAGDGWDILTKDNALVQVHSDLDSIIERGQNILYCEEDASEVEDTDRYYSEL